MAETIIQHIFLLFCVIISLAIALAGMQISHAVDTDSTMDAIDIDYTVSNRVASTPGGSRFSSEIGYMHCTETMDLATNFVWTTFQQQSDPADRKEIEHVTLFIEENIDNDAYTNDNEIHLSAGYIQDYSDDVKTEITGILYREMAHVWQWNGNGNANDGLIDGIANYVRLKADYAPSNWVQPGEGDQWDQGREVTAYFLDYCNNIYEGFVVELNKKMRDDYNDNYFLDLTGKSVDQLWGDYKRVNSDSTDDQLADDDSIIKGEGCISCIKNMIP